MSAPPVIEIDNASLVKGNGHRALDGVSLVVREGEHSAILGPNGAGKSTLMKMLALLHYPLAGPGDAPPIRIFGRERWNVLELRRQLGIVSSEFERSFADPALGRVTGLETVVSAFFGSHALPDPGTIAADIWERGRRALAEADAALLADKPLEQMSTGEARRVSIARALVHAPRALLLDEPTAGLDLAARGRFLDGLGALARNGRTLILVTHHVEEVLPEIRRVVLLRRGRVFRDGPKEEVLTAANLSELYGMPVALDRDPADRYRAALASA